MIKYLLFICLILCGASACKSKKTIARLPTTDPEHASKYVMGLDEAQRRIFLSKLDSSDLHFQSLSAKGTIHFTQNGTSHSAELTLRIKKDQIIWFYVNVSILPLAQGYITPTDIKLKNLLTGEYTHKDFSYFQQISGVALQFADLQSMLIGNKMSSFISDSSRFRTASEGGYELSGSQHPLKNKFFYSPQFKPVALDFADSVHHRKMNLHYGDFHAQGVTSLPQQIYILAEAEQSNIEIQMDYRRVVLNPEQDYPFHSPDENR